MNIRIGVILIVGMVIGSISSMQQDRPYESATGSIASSYRCIMILFAGKLVRTFGSPSAQQDASSESSDGGSSGYDSSDSDKGSQQRDWQSYREYCAEHQERD